MYVYTQRLESSDHESNSGKRAGHDWDSRDATTALTRAFTSKLGHVATMRGVRPRPPSPARPPLHRQPFTDTAHFTTATFTGPTDCPAPGLMETSNTRRTRASNQPGVILSSGPSTCPGHSRSAEQKLTAGS